MLDALKAKCIGIFHNNIFEQLFSTFNLIFQYYCQCAIVLLQFADKYAICRLSNWLNLHWKRHNSSPFLSASKRVKSNLSLFIKLSIFTLQEIYMKVKLRSVINQTSNHTLYLHLSASKETHIQSWKCPQKGIIYILTSEQVRSIISRHMSILVYNQSLIRVNFRWVNSQKSCFYLLEQMNHCPKIGLL